MAGQGSTGNVIAALCSFFIPGLGQLIQGRLMIAIVQFVLAAVLWIVLLGWLIHLWSILDAALYKGSSLTIPPASRWSGRTRSRSVYVAAIRDSQAELRMRSRAGARPTIYSPSFFRSDFQRSQAESCALRFASDASGASPARMKP